MSNPFATAAMAEGYARSRPPLHALIVERALTLLGRAARIGVALDLGCGAGLSTGPLEGIADSIIGIDPVHEMLVFARTVVPAAHFLVGRGEALPLRSGTVDLITAAGSLNFTAPAAVFPEAARVLKSEGTFCVYDFSQGRRFRSSDALDGWFSEFLNRYPRPAGQAIPLSPEILAGMDSGFRIIAHENFEIALPMSASAYADYMATETNVAFAIRNGAGEPEIRAWLRESLDPVFEGGVRDVVFPGYVVCMRA